MSELLFRKVYLSLNCSSYKEKIRQVLDKKLIKIFKFSNDNLFAISCFAPSKLVMGLFFLIFIVNKGSF